jgi:hypothetical protein
MNTYDKNKKKKLKTLFAENLVTVSAGVWLHISFEAFLTIVALNVDEFYL